VVHLDWRIVAKSLKEPRLTEVRDVCCSETCRLTISTRRFWVRPASVSLLAAGA
jgi:hypothetical protein